MSSNPDPTKVTRPRAVLGLTSRNSKQIQMIKKHKIPNKIVLDFDFWN